MERPQGKEGDIVHGNRRAWAEGSHTLVEKQTVLTMRRFKKQRPKQALILKPSAIRALISSEYATRPQAHKLV